MKDRIEFIFEVEMKNTIKVAIIGSGGEWSALPTVRELGKKSHKPYILFQNLHTPSAYSRYLSGKYRIPNEISCKMLEEIVELCEREKITHIICLNEEIKYFLIKNKKMLGDLRYAFPSIESYEIAISKGKSSSFVKSLDIPVPDTIQIKSLDELEKLKFDFKKPIVVKGVRGVSSLHVRYAWDCHEVIKLYEEVYELERDERLADSLPLIQEYVGGPTYLTQGLAQEGVVKIVVPHIKLREWPISGGVTSRARTINEPKLIEYSKRIMEALEWHGEFGLEWKYDEDKDDFYFLEINPRFEGSLDIAVKAGVNLPNLLLKIINGEKVPDNLKFRPNTEYRFFFRNDFKYFLERPYGLWRLIWESINPKVHGEVTMDDIGVLRAFWKMPVRDFMAKYLKRIGG